MVTDSRHTNFKHIVFPTGDNKVFFTWSCDDMWRHVKTPLWSGNLRKAKRSGLSASSCDFKSQIPVTLVLERRGDILTLLFSDVESDNDGCGVLRLHLHRLRPSHLPFCVYHRSGTAASHFLDSRVRSFWTKNSKLVLNHVLWSTNNSDHSWV